MCQHFSDDEWAAMLLEADQDNTDETDNSGFVDNYNFPAETPESDIADVRDESAYLADQDESDNKPKSDEYSESYSN